MAYTKKKKKKVVKKVKVIKPALPVRESPFELKDEVIYFDGRRWFPGVITLKDPPNKTNQPYWVYRFNKQFGALAPEGNILPLKIFHLLATDVDRFDTPEWCEALVNHFNSPALILAAYRKGQKRPWAYYVIPDKNEITKVKDYTTKGSWGNSVKAQVNIQIKPANQLNLSLIPISSAPREILTYLGQRLFNGLWRKDNG
jgi:hypothetical protein